MNALHEGSVITRLRRQAWPANDGAEITFTHVLGQLVAAQRGRARGRMRSLLALAAGLTLVAIASFY